MSELSSVIRIHPDRIITHQDFASQAKDTLLISGTFMTIQGEGPFAGHPAFFIRMAGCNYGDKEKHCGGKGLSCDTDFRYDKGKTVHVDDLLDELRESRAKVLVLTGGEPLLQAAGIKTLLTRNMIGSETPSYGQVETNGIYLSSAIELMHHIPLHVVVSPKAHQDHGYSHTHLKHIVRTMIQFPRMYLKVLIGEAPYDHVPPAVLAAPPELNERIYLSPITVYASAYEGEVANSWDPKLVDQETTARNHSLAAQLVLEHRYRLTMQMHNFCRIA